MTYINQSSYWLTYFPHVVFRCSSSIKRSCANGRFVCRVRGFLVFSDLAQILNLLWILIRMHLFGRTPRDIREWTKPSDFEYSVYYTNLLFMGTIALVFASLAPLVTLAGAIVFWMSVHLHVKGREQRGEL